MQIHSFTQPRQCPPPGPIVGFPFTYNLLQPIRQHGADGGAVLRRKNSGFPQQIRVELQGNVGLHGSTYLRAAQLYVLMTLGATVMPAAR